MKLKTLKDIYKENDGESDCYCCEYDCRYRLMEVSKECIKKYKRLCKEHGYTDLENPKRITDEVAEAYYRGKYEALIEFFNLEENNAII